MHEQDDEQMDVTQSDLHAWFHDLVDQYKILRYSWNIQDVLDVGLIALFGKRDIINILNRVSCVFPSFNIAGLFGSLRSRNHTSSMLDILVGLEATI
mgnify:CR=1 FL=1